VSLAALLVFAGCQDGTAPTAVTGSTAAQLGFSADVVSGAAAADLRVIFNYQRLDGSFAALGSHTVSLASDAEQLVPVTVDLGACLRDAQHVSSGSASDDCLVQLDVQLVVGGAVVDRQIVGPISLRGGQSQTLGQTVILRDVGAIVLRSSAGDSGTVRVETGRTVSLTPTVLDGAQRPVTGRTIEWATSNPAVATVSTAGVVTAVATGTARIAASTGGRSGFIDMRVVAPPQTMRIVSGGLTGAGTVRSVPAGIDCTITGQTVTGSCVTDFPSDVTVQLTATPVSGTQFVGWSGNCATATTPVCSVPMDVGAVVGPVFRALGTLQVTAIGGGTGVISSDVGAISCQVVSSVTAGSCATTLPEGTLVLLRATPSGSSVFRGWTGACVSTATTCTVSIQGAQIAVANFDLPVAIGVQGTGAGVGSVTSSPAGISCGLSSGNPTGTCISFFPQGTVVTLTANASGSSAFRRWGGACLTSTSNSCQLVATGGALTVTAQFDLPVNITLSLSGNGLGNVSGTQMNCSRANNSNSGVCARQVLAGSTVSLTATPGLNSEFAGWSGACSNTAGTTCTFTAEVSTFVGAAFRSTNSVVTVAATAGATGGGMVGNSEESLVCDLQGSQATGVCSITVPPNTSMTLFANADDYSAFGGWGGACASAGTDTTCELTTTTGAVNISATFTRQPTVNLTVTLNGPTGGTATLGGLVTSTTATCVLADNAQSPANCVWEVPLNKSFTVTLSSQAGSGYFTSSPLCYMDLGSCTVSGLTSAGVVSAVFSASFSEWLERFEWREPRH
jgi:hypothetical protein